jgi:dGTPase
VTPAALAHLRFPVERTRGRRYPEPAHPYRDEFQRDRDRVIHARAFRRLEDKTQVFAAGVSDHFRNRLTHTIEVSQIARTVARTLGLNEDLTEALALVHDVGHPPFAHSGEAELDSVMRRFGERFDHNLHALRIVESFEHPYASFPGLNLTFEVREGIVKHSHDFEPGELPKLDEYLPGLRPLLEAQLIDLADEIAYDTADLDDAYDAGLVSMEDALNAVGLIRELYAETRARFPDASDRERMYAVVRGLIDSLVAGLIEGTAEAAGSLAGPDSVRAHPGRVARFSAGPAETAAQLKRFLRQTVYESGELARSRKDSSGRITALFDLFLACPERLPTPYREQASREPLHRVVCDYIAGMTDGFFARTYAQAGLANPS